MQTFDSKRFWPFYNFKWNIFKRINMLLFHIHTQSYPYLDIDLELVWSNDPDSCAGSSSATGRVSHTRQVKGDDLDKKGYPGPPGWASSMRLITSPFKKAVFQNLMKSRRLRLNVGCNGPAAAAALFVHSLWLKMSACYVLSVMYNLRSHHECECTEDKVFYVVSLLQ
jgi:hypothetical protein